MKGKYNKLGCPQLATWKLHLTIILIAALFSGSPAIFAGEPLKEPTLAKDLVFESPSKSVYKVDPWTDWTIITLTAAESVYLTVNPGPYIWRECPCDPNTVNPFDRPQIYYYNQGLYTAANATLIASIAGPIFLDANDLGFSKEFNQDMLVFLEVLSVDQALINSLKFIIQRPLPHRYNPSNTSPSEPLDFTAMPSGHTSMVAAALSATAMTVNLRYGTNYLSWIIAGVLTGSIGLELIYSGEHFATDVIIGGLLGVGVGITVPLLHELKLDSGNHFNIYPMPNGLGVKYGIVF